MPFVVLGAAGVAVVSYLVPLIISCIVGGVTVIVTFISTRAFYKREHQKDVEVQNLKKQQVERDNAMHEEASRLAHAAGLDLQILLKLSKEQLSEFKSAIQDFMRNIDDSDIATKNLTSIANTIQETANIASLECTDLHRELEMIKQELIMVYGKLSNTEQMLALKESELKQTIDKLNELGEKIIAHEILEKLDDLEDLHQEYGHLEAREAEIIAKNDEIAVLRSKNLALGETIESLNKTISKLQKKLNNHSESEKIQIQEIQKLIIDNKLLTETIEALTESMEEQNERATKFTTNQLKIFK